MVQERVVVRTGTCRSSVVVVVVAMLATLAAAVGTVPPAEAATRLDPATVRIAGDSRLGTAVALSRTAFPSGAATIVVARADSYADALAGSPLAAALDAPILLTGPGGLAPEVAAEVERLGARSAVLLGGTGALAPAVADALAGKGLDVDRIGGADRYDTAARVAARVRELAVDPLTPTGAFVVEGASADPNRGWPDAVAVAPLAAQLRWPILLTHGRALPDATAAGIRAMRADGLSGLTIVGGTGAVSAAVEGALIGLHPVVDRIAGQTRYETSALVAARHLEQVDATTVLLASGANWPDALVSGPAAAAMQAPLLLTDPGQLVGPAADVIRSRELAGIGLIGGPVAIGDAVLDQARAAAPTVSATALPTSGSRVTVPAGATMVLDRATSRLGRVEVHGTLRLLPGADLDAESIAVHGRLLAGSALAPTDDVTVRLRGVAAQLGREHTGTGGLEVHGGTLTLVGATRPTAWTRLAETAGAGSRSLLLARAPGWRPGDRLVVAPTGVDPSEAEQVVVDSVDGRVVRLREPLAHTHVAVTDRADGRVHLQAAEVGLLSQPITIVGEGSVGGHVMAMRHGQSDMTTLLRGVRLHRLGQAGQLARYSFHWHMAGPSPAARLDTVSVTDAQHRCATIHGTRRAIVTRLVAHGVMGHCIFFEDGAETGNLVADSLVVGVAAPRDGTAILDTDREPAAYWIQHPSNSLLHSAAAGGVGHGVWLDLVDHPTGMSEDDDVRPREAPAGVYVGNAAHGFTDVDFGSGVGLRVDDYEGPTELRLADWDLWQNEAFGAWLESTEQTHLTDSRVTGGRTGVQLHGGKVTDTSFLGWSSNPVDPSWARIGVGAYHGGGVVHDVGFTGFVPDVSWRRTAAVSSATHSHQTVVRVSGVRMVDVPTALHLAPGSEDGDENWVGVVDVDGSLTGRATTYVSHRPMTRTDCRSAGGGITGFRCDGTDLRTAGVFLHDLDADTPMGASTVRDDRGRTAPAIDRDDDGKVEWIAPHGSTNRVDLGRTTPTHLEVIQFGRQRVTTTTSLAWPHADLYVYRGWGEWADPIAVRGSGAPGGDRVVRSGGRVQLRTSGEADANGGGYWNRWLLCAEQHCGDGTGSRR